VEYWNDGACAPSEVRTRRKVLYLYTSNLTLETPSGIGFVSHHRPQGRPEGRGETPRPASREIGFVSQDSLRPIGFVLPRSTACTMHHNSFPAQHLPFTLLRCELGLFGIIAPRPMPFRTRIGRRQGASRRRAVLNPQSEIRNREIGFVLHNPQSAIRDPQSGDWLCFVEARSLYKSP
jgi:hypothetical protein